MTKSLGFSDLVDRRMLQAERDMARVERRLVLAEQALAAAAPVKAGLQQEVQQERQRALALQAELDGMRASTSWHVSGPIRALGSAVQALRRGRLPQKESPAPQPELAPAPAAAVPLPPREDAILQRLQARVRD